MDEPAPNAVERTRKKPSYPIGPELRAYLKKFRRELEASCRAASSSGAPLQASSSRR